MEFISLEVVTQPSLTLPWPEVPLAPLGDIQSGVSACDEDRLKRHVDWCLEYGFLFLGMGDYVDMQNPSDRKRVRGADYTDTTTNALTERAEQDIENFLRLVDGTQGKWVGLVSGHHYMDFGGGDTSDTRIATALDAPFLGDCASVRLTLTGDHKPAVADILVHHGQGSSSTEAGALTSVMKFGTGFGHHDIVLTGHHHKKVTTKKPRPFYDDEGVLTSRNTVYAVTGSFLRGYMPCSQSEGRAGGSYVEKRMLPPVALGGVVLRIRAKGDGRLDVDVEL
jgi:hypothetical protein